MPTTKLRFLFEKCKDLGEKLYYDLKITGHSLT